MPTAPSFALTGTTDQGGATVTNLSTVPLTVGDCTDITHVFVTETATVPTAVTAGWVACSTVADAVSVAMTAPTTESDYTIKLWAKDSAGNVSATATTENLKYDTTAPSLAITSALSALKGGTTYTLNFTMTEWEAKSAENILVEFFNGTAWASLTTINVASTGTLTAEPYSYASVSVPSLNVSTAAMRLTVTDAAGNTATMTSADFIIDSTAPTISSYVLNGGIGATASNFVPVAITATDNLTTVTHYRMSTSSTYADTGWLPYQATFNFGAAAQALSQTFYIWVKDELGHVSASQNATIYINFGNPPAISMIKPDGTSSYSTGNPVEVQFLASSTIGLAAANALILDYTADGGITYSADFGTPVSWTIPNNGSNGGCIVDAGMTGCYTFSLPAALNATAFRLRLRAIDVAGGTSGFIGAIINAPGLKHIAGRITNMTGVSALSAQVAVARGLAVDSQGNLYSGSNSRIYKIPATSGKWEVFQGTGTPGGEVVGTAPSSSNPTSYWQHQLLAVDLNDRLYWPSNGNIFRVNGSGLVEQYFGGITNNFANAHGAHRLSVQLSFSSFTFDSQNRLYVMAWSGAAGAIFRVNANDNLARVVGDLSTTAPQDGVDARLTGVSVGGQTASLFTIRRGTPDRIYYFIQNDGYYEVPLDTFITRKISTAMSTYSHNEAILWDSHRNRLVSHAYFSSQLHFLNVDDGTFTSIIPHENTVLGGWTELTSITQDRQGGIYFGTRYSPVIHYLGTDNVQRFYAGVLPGAGDGGPATQAIFGYLGGGTAGWDSAGGLYLADWGTRHIRRIDPGTGIVQALAWRPDHPHAILSRGVGTTSPLVGNNYNPRFTGPPFLLPTVTAWRPLPLQR